MIQKGVFFILPVKQRIKFLSAISIGLGLFLFARVFSLQIPHHYTWARKAVHQRAAGIDLGKSRGVILDRFGNELTQRQRKTVVLCIPALLKSEGLAFLSQAGVRIKEEEKDEVTLVKLEGAAVMAGARPYRECDGIYQLTIWERAEPGLAQHLLGGLDSTGRKGCSGLERLYDGVLSGDDYRWLNVIVDGHHKPIPGLGWRYSSVKVKGGKEAKDVQISLDPMVQKIVERIMDEKGVKKGAVLIMQAGTGEILAMASRPLFTTAHSGDGSSHRDRPFLNRALESYQPGSLLQILVAAAALEGGKVQPETTFNAQGYNGVDQWMYGLMSQGVRERIQRLGLISFRQALAYSCPPVFIDVGLKTGVERILRLLQEYGIGQEGGLGLPEEACGTLPAAFGMEFRDKLHFLLGEEHVYLTPLQVGAIIQSIANNGVYLPPSLVQGFKDGKGKWSVKFPPPRGRRVISTKTALTLRGMLEGVVAYGTGQAAAHPSGAAGKTGKAPALARALTVAGKNNAETTGLDHGWFAGYAPAHAPRLIGVVLIEEEPERWGEAAEIFGEIMKELL